MKDRFEKRTGDYSAKQKRKKLLSRITSVLVAAVVFCTTYALILPAITMDNAEHQCGIEEHIHTEECTVQIFDCVVGHIHTEACLDENGEYSCGYVIAHNHTERCYDEESQLICELDDGETAVLFEEHIHNESCYEQVRGDVICDMTDTPKEEEVEVIICGMDETEGHTHTDECVQTEEVLICTAEEEHEHTEECFEMTETMVCGQDECAAHTHSDECFEIELNFSFDIHLHNDDCYEWVEELVCDGEYVSEELNVCHEHIEECFEDGVCICGEIEEIQHDHTEECMRMACTLAEHTHCEECIPIYEMDAKVLEDNLEIQVVLKNEQGIPQNTVIEVTKLEQDDKAYSMYQTAATEKSVGKTDYLTAYSVRFKQNGEEITFSESTVTVSVTAKKEEKTELFEISDNDVPDTEANHFTTLQILGDDVVEGATATIEAGSEEEAVMMFSLGSSESFAIARSVEAYPLFNVQYYANMNRFAPEATSSEAHIPIINTATENNPDEYLGELGSGGSLPVNGNGSSASPTAHDVYRLALENIGGSQYQVKMQLTPTEIYEAHNNVIYSNTLTVKALDVLYENGHYEIDFIRTQSEEQLEKQTLAGVTGLDEAYWTKYDVVNDIYSEYYFTNDPDAAETDDKKPIVITDGMTVRYVYHPTTADSLTYTPTNFFDYDISNASYTSGGVNYMYTDKRGINSHEDNKSATTYLAFGNSNTDTGYGTVTWTDENGVSTTPNQYNSTGYLGCTFGIVSDYNWAEKRLVYSNNIDAPCFFTHDATGVTGKTSYLHTDTSGSTMNFTRYGDTYTLESVSGNQNIKASNLDTFTGRVFGTRTLYSNDFWPMDYVWNKDFHFGDTATYTAGTKKFDGETRTGNLPVSDDGLEHNSYFGLQFAVDFHLDGTYDGPLEYLFYGDDDMWVFLTDRTDPDNITTNLIADIGGVHSSVGSYTNLWDWVPNTAERHLGKGEYTLTFFYTERGASGSSCFMQFTIPDVIGTPILDTESGELLVRKNIKNDEEYEGSFAFDYHIDSGMSRYYPYTIYEEADGTAAVVQEGSLLYTGQFMLEANQYIVIDDLPIGTAYTVKEVSGEYTPGWTYPNTATYSNFAVSGTVETTGRVELTCVNTLTYRLPDTGGEGTYVYMFGGTLLMGAAIILLVYNEKKRRRT